MQQIVLKTFVERWSSFSSYGEPSAKSRSGRKLKEVPICLDSKMQDSRRRCGSIFFGVQQQEEISLYLNKTLHEKTNGG